MPDLSDEEFHALIERMEQVEKMKENKSPADTLKRGVGNWHDIDMLFAALAAASGFDARVAKVVQRAEDFFDRSARDEASENDAKSEI